MQTHILTKICRLVASCPGSAWARQGTRGLASLIRHAQAEPGHEKTTTYRPPCYPLLLILLLCFLLSSSLSRAAEKTTSTKSSHSLQLRDGMLTARVTATSLREVMAEFSRLSGAQVRWFTANGGRQVSVDFTALSLDEALRRLLDPYNFVLLYTAEGDHSTLTQLWISAAAPPRSDLARYSAAPPPRAVVETEEEREEAEERLRELEDESMREQRMEAEYQAALAGDREWPEE